jgi:hypothetical protein
MTTYYNITKSSITGKYKLHTWFVSGENTIDEGCTMFTSRDAVNKALEVYTDAKALTAELCKEFGIEANMGQYS